MIALFGEGVETIAQPCSLPILLSAGVFGLAGGRNLGLAIVAHTAGLAVMAWARFARVITVDLADGPALLGGAMVVTAAVAVATTADGPHRRRVVGAGAVVAGAIAAAVWQPCVGTELAGIVNDAPTNRIGALVPIAVYVAGTALVALAVALLPTAFPSVRRHLDGRGVPTVGAALGVSLGVAMAVGFWGDIVNELLERSSA